MTNGLAGIYQIFTYKAFFFNLYKYNENPSDHPPLNEFPDINYIVRINLLAYCVQIALILKKI